SRDNGRGTKRPFMATVEPANHWRTDQPIDYGRERIVPPQPSPGESRASQARRQADRRDDGGRAHGVPGKWRAGSANSRGGAGRRLWAGAEVLRRLAARTNLLASGRVGHHLLFCPLADLWDAAIAASRAGFGF